MTTSEDVRSPDGANGPWPTPRSAASVILVRACAPRDPGPGGAGAGYEVFLLRRHRKASFMSSTFVFPGGAADPGEDDLRITAARELFEEAGVLLARGMPDAPGTLARWRASLLANETTLPALLADAGLAIDTAALRYFAHWITPSVEPKRFSAQFFVAELPAGQTPSFDNRETVDEIWVTPAEALARAGELRLPPPQVHTFAAMRDAGDDLASLHRAADARGAAPHPIMPRMCPLPTGFALLLPWDPDYATRGTGDTAPMPADHPLARGPSRFILEDATWKNVHAPAPPSPTEG
jgi:8-oxo-dGTP pyrophosphatase MutT (NUDIX family)